MVYGTEDLENEIIEKAKRMKQKQLKSFIAYLNDIVECEMIGITVDEPMIDLECYNRVMTPEEVNNTYTSIYSDTIPQDISKLYDTLTSHLGFSEEQLVMWLNGLSEFQRNEVVRCYIAMVDDCSITSNSMMHHTMTYGRFMKIIRKFFKDIGVIINRSNRPRIKYSYKRGNGDDICAFGINAEGEKLTKFDIPSSYHYETDLINSMNKITL